MSKDSYWFKHDSNASQDLKLKALRKQYGWQGSGWYWYLIETLRNEDGYQLNYSDFTFESLAEDMKVDTEAVKKFIDDCIKKFHLFTLEDDILTSDRLLRDMATLDDKREKARSAGKASAAQRRISKEGTHSQPDFDAFVKDMRETYPDLDIDHELIGFNLYWSEGTRKLKRPKSAFLNWLNKAREIKKQGREPREHRQHAETTDEERRLSADKSQPLG